MPKRRDGSVGDLYEAVGAELRLLRMKKKWRQEELAASVGISRASIANIESGRQAIALHHFASIATALGSTASAVLEVAALRSTKRSNVPENLPATVQTFLRTRIGLST